MQVLETGRVLEAHRHTIEREKRRPHLGGSFFLDCMRERRCPTLGEEVLVAGLVVARVPLVLAAVATALDGDEDLVHCPFKLRKS